MTLTTGPVLNGRPPPSRTRRVRAWTAWTVQQAGIWRRRAGNWRWKAALPGIAAILLVSVAVAGIVAWAVAWPPGLWAGLGTLGVFLLRVDNRLPPVR